MQSYKPKSKGKGKGRAGARGSSRKGPAKRDNRISRANRFARFQIQEGTKIEYKNFPFLQKFLTDRGKIISRRITGISARQQRELAQSIKRARYLALVSPGPSAKK